MFKQNKRIKNHKLIHFEGNSIIASKSDVRSVLKEYGNQINSVKMNGKTYHFGIDFDDIFHKNGKTILSFGGSVIDSK